MKALTICQPYAFSGGLALGWLTALVAITLKSVRRNRRRSSVDKQEQ